MTTDLEKRMIAILYRTMYEYTHGIISSDGALSIISTINRMIPETETSSKKVWKYSNRLRKCILDTETRINWQIAKEKREVWENNSKTLCPELNNETNLTLDDEFFIALEY